MEKEPCLDHGKDSALSRDTQNGYDGNVMINPGNLVYPIFKQGLPMDSENRSFGIIGIYRNDKSVREQF